MKKFSILLILAVAGFMPLQNIFALTPPLANHPIGTNVIDTSGTVYRIMQGPNINAYTSAGAFLSYKFNSWADVVPANEADLALLEKGKYYISPREGSLVNDKGTVYLVTGGGSRAGFASEAVFKGYGYSYTNVYSGDTSFMNTYPAMTSYNMLHPDGTLINYNGTLYQMESGTRLAFPSVEVLESWGYWVTDAVPANSYDIASSVSGVMVARQPSELSY
jgi:hypothetical protein